MTTVTENGSGRLTPWPAAPGFFLGLAIADLWPGIGIPAGIISLLVAAALFFTPNAPRWAAWLAAGFTAGVVVLLLLALLQLLNPNATPNTGIGSASAPPPR